MILTPAPNQVWGKTSKDFVVEGYTAAMDPTATSPSGATALFFLSDRDVKLIGNTSPWGTRAPYPTFNDNSCVHVLPLQSLEDSVEQNSVNSFIQAPYAGGGAMEISMEGLKELNFMLEVMEMEKMIAKDALNDIGTRLLSEQSPSAKDSPSTTPTRNNDSETFVIDTPISFGPENDVNYSFARTSYRLDSIPEGPYALIICQLSDDPSLVILSNNLTGFNIGIFAASDYPSDGIEEVPVKAGNSLLQHVDVSTDGQYIVVMIENKLKIVSRKAEDVLSFISDTTMVKNIANIDGLHLNIWPALEFQQMYRDAWRMLRDYFYDSELTSLPWDSVFDRYLPLVDRCAKREELDDGKSLMPI